MRIRIIKVGKSRARPRASELVINGQPAKGYELPEDPAGTLRELRRMERQHELLTEQDRTRMTRVLMATIESLEKQSNGVKLIERERVRQIVEEGFDVAHDDQRSDGSLAVAAACYAIGEEIWGGLDWPWSHSSWKPSTDRLRDLEKAGALIAAEIDRLLRFRAIQGDA